MNYVENIRNNQHVLFTYESRTMDENMKQYCEYYHLPTEDIQYHFGFEQVAHERLFVQSFCPSQVKAKILLVHGYYDHTGVLSTFIRFLVQKGYHVLTFDLPGHGLSTGEQATISDFRYIQIAFERSCKDICHQVRFLYILQHIVQEVERRLLIE